MHLRQSGRTLQDVFPNDRRPVKHAGANVRLDHRARCPDLRGLRFLSKELELQRVRKLELVEGEKYDALPGDDARNAPAIRFRVVELQEAARVEIDHRSP